MVAAAEDPRRPERSAEAVEAGPPSSQVTRRAELPSTVSHLSLVTGGPVYVFLLRIGLFNLGLPNAMRRMVALIGVTWFPLLIFSVRDGVALGRRVQVPLLYDYSVYGRFLLSLPLLILAEIVIEPALRTALEEFVRSGIIQQKELSEFDEVLRKAQRLRDSAIPELSLLVIAFFPVFLFHSDWAVGAASSWHTTADHLTLGGWWFVTISSPLLRFIVYRWVFCYGIWTLLLWRIIRLNVHLIPTHPDHAAGLGFLRLAQVRFGMLFCALGCTFAGETINRVLHQGVPLASFKFLMAGFVLLSVTCGLLPLMLLAPTMAKVRRVGLLKYGRLGNQYAELFELKWIRPAEPPLEPLLGTGDIQSLADLRNGYAIIEDMLIAPITKRLTLLLTAQAAAPLVPVIILGTPTTELVKAIIKMVV